jgi:vanillate/4-hydroxybenzoate decarboxylase subunit D
VSSYPRPQELTLSVEKEAVEGTCPACGKATLKRYPVLSEGGWFQVVKCQSCLHSVSREPWSRLGPIAVLVDSL